MSETGDSGNTSATKNNSHSFEPKESGLYLLAIEKAHEGYVVEGDGDTVVAPNVTINGRYIGTSDRFETECDGVEITEDNEVNLLYD